MTPLCPTCLHNRSRNKLLPQPVDCAQLALGLSPGWPDRLGVLQRRREVECPRYAAEPKLSIID